MRRTFLAMLMLFLAVLLAPNVAWASAWWPIGAITSRMVYSNSIDHYSPPHFVTNDFAGVTSASLATTPNVARPPGSALFTNMARNSSGSTNVKSVPIDNTIAGITNFEDTYFSSLAPNAGRRRLDSGNLIVIDTVNDKNISAPQSGEFRFNVSRSRLHPATATPTD